MPVVSTRAIPHLNTFLWGSAELPRATPCGISPISFLPRESRSFPATPFDVREKRTPVKLHGLSLSYWERYKALRIKLLCAIEVFYNPLPIIIRADLLVVVLRIFHGKGAEGNGETPAGKKCRVRPHRTQSEEAHRAPAESELFPAAPIHSTKVSKSSL